MRVPSDMAPPTRRLAGRTGLVVLVVAALVVLTSVRTVAVFFTDYLWFDEIGRTDVWSTMLLTRLGLSAAFTAVFFVLLYANLLIADRIAPKFRGFEPDEELVERYHELVGPHASKVRVGVSVLFALLAGIGAASQYDEWILFRNATEFGVEDPQFGRDVGFYVFRLPFISYVVDWAFVALAIVLVLTVVAHYLNGGIRLQSAFQRVTPQVKAHLSVLLGAIALVKAAGYWYERFELNFSERGVVEGAGYTDVNAQLPALHLLIGISVFSALLLIVNIRQRGWRLPVIAMALWAFVSIVVASIYPAVVQNVRVQPNEIELEREYIQRNIDATREAMGIANVTERTFPYDENLTASALAANAETVRNVRLWDPAVLESTYSKLQEFRQYYEFADVDIDRYEVDGERRQVVLSVRGLKPEGIPGDSWVKRHLQYTHGYGAVLSPANAVDSEGRPAFLVSELPPEGAIEIDEPRVYYGEDLPGYAIVKTKQPELDYQTDDGEDQTSSYNGRGGVELSSALRRSAFFLRFSDVNLLISGQVTDESRVIFNRDIRDRVRTAAPFLRYDSDPYPAIIDGRILWIQDAYTTTNHYPYAESANADGVRAGSELRSGFNYVRNSVKVIIDAYDGSMTFYLWDAEDPIARAYAKAFPDMFVPASQMPDEVREHVRYPEDLFRVQANMYGRYHVTRADSFYSENDAWDIAQDPGTGRVSNALQRTETTQAPGQGVVVPAESGRLDRMEPTYLLLQLPGESEPSFLILQPFVPTSRTDEQINLTSFLVAKSDPESYGELQAFVMPRGEQVDGPLVVNSAIQADAEIAQEITLLDGRGSRALFGQVQVIPIGESLLYVRPLYVTAEQTELPQVKKVIVVYANRAVMRDTLQEALTVLFGAAPETLEEPGGDEPPRVPNEIDDSEIADLLQRATEAFDDADAALREGDLAEFQEKVEEGREYVRQANERASNSSTPTTTTTTTTVASA